MQKSLNVPPNQLFEAHDQPKIVDLAFSPDGKFFSIDSYVKPMDIWQLDKNNPFAYFTMLPLPKNDGLIFNIAFTDSSL